MIFRAIRLTMRAFGMRIGLAAVEGTPTTAAAAARPHIQMLRSTGARHFVCGVAHLCECLWTLFRFRLCIPFLDVHVQVHVHGHHSVCMYVHVL